MAVAGAGAIVATGAVVAGATALEAEAGSTPLATPEGRDDDGGRKSMPIEGSPAAIAAVGGGQARVGCSPGTIPVPKG